MPIGSMETRRGRPAEGVAAVDTVTLGGADYVVQQAGLSAREPSSASTDAWIRRDAHRSTSR
jgi:hypothetical protein